MTISLTGEVNWRMLENLISALKGDKDITIYFSSWGGYTDTLEALRHLIDSNADRIKLIAFGEISSAAFILFFMSKCKKQALANTYGIAHLASCTYKLTSNGTAKDICDRESIKDLKIENERSYKNHELIGLNSKELKKILKGEDVYISYERMQELIML